MLVLSSHEPLWDGNEWFRDGCPQECEVSVEEVSQPLFQAAGTRGPGPALPLPSSHMPLVFTQRGEPCLVIDLMGK